MAQVAIVCSSYSVCLGRVCEIVPLFPLWVRDKGVKDRGPPEPPV